MKKLLATLVFGAIFASISFAQNLSFGVRGSFGLSNLTIENNTKHELGKDLAGVMYELTGRESSYSVDNEGILCGGFSLWGNKSFEKIPALGIQVELGFLFNNGTELTGEAKSGNIKAEVKDEITYTTMELPVLVTYTVNKGGFFEFIPQTGFYLSFPIGKINQDLDIKAAGFKDSDSEKSKIDNTCILGAVFGADFAFNINKTSAFLINSRYMIDFSAIKSEGDKIGRRTSFLLSAGYRHTLR